MILKKYFLIFIAIIIINITPSNGQFERFGFFINPIKELLQLLTVKFDRNYTGINVTQTIEYHGYRSEEHKVITEDGYILTIHRLLPRKNETVGQYRPVVFVQHGIFCSSACFVGHGPNRMFAYKLVDHGYDVWLGNTRGNVYSRDHIKYNPDYDDDFWKYSLTEIGKYDLPAVIDYTLKRTNQRNLHYIGHSQGSTTFFIMCSELPKYSRKIKSVVALAPVVYLDVIPFRLKAMSISFRLIAETAISLNVLEILPITKEIGDFISNLCTGFLSFCQKVLNIMSVIIPEHISAEDIPVITKYCPAGSTVYTIKHYLQIHKSGRFAYYDYGIEENLEKYGTEKPPLYNLTKVTNHVTLISSKDDLLVSDEDLSHLHRSLPSAVKFIIHSRYGHIGFIWGDHSKYWRILLRTLKNHNHVQR